MVRWHRRRFWGAKISHLYPLSALLITLGILYSPLYPQNTLVGSHLDVLIGADLFCLREVCRRIELERELRRDCLNSCLRMVNCVPSDGESKHLPKRACFEGRVMSLFYSLASLNLSSCY